MNLVIKLAYLLYFSSNKLLSFIFHLMFDYFLYSFSLILLLLLYLYLFQLLQLREFVGETMPRLFSLAKILLLLPLLPCLMINTNICVNRQFILLFVAGLLDFFYKGFVLLADYLYMLLLVLMLGLLLDIFIFKFLILLILLFMLMFVFIFLSYLLFIF